MKIALIIKSPLLQKALITFLSGKISSYEQCDFVIADREIETKKPLFRLGHKGEVDLKIPFSKELLLEKVDHFYQKELLKIPKSAEEERLESALKALQKRQKKRIQKLAKSYYE